MYSAGIRIHADKVPLVLIAKFLVVAEILYVFNLVCTKLYDEPRVKSPLKGFTEGM